MPASRIRLATPEDAAAIAAIYAPSVRDSYVSFEIDPPSADEMAGRIARTLPRTPWLVCQRGSEILGYAYASRHRERAAYQWSVDVSAYVRPNARRVGVARAMYTSIFAALSVQGFNNAYAGIALPNPASVGLHQAVGFALVGVYHRVGYKLGAWHDVAWYERSLGAHAAAPPPPTPLAELVGTAVLSAALRKGEQLLTP